VPSVGTAQEAYQNGIVKADNVDETWPKWQHVQIAQEAKYPKRQNSPRGIVAREANISRGKVSI
jgi:hypothetical protein